MERLIAVVLAAGVLGLALSGCSLRQVDPRPAPIVAPAAAWSLQSRAAPVAAQRWWESFGSPQLNALVETALSGNLDLRTALARLDQADAVLGQRRALSWPTLDLNANASRGKSVLFVGNQRVQTINNRYGLSLAAAYEVDLWGRVRNQRGAAWRDREATRLDALASAHAIAAQVTETWLNLIEVDARLALVREQIELNDKFTELTRLRFENGAGSIVAVRQQEQQAAGVRAQAPLLVAQSAVLRNQLAVLLGQAPTPPSGPEPRVAGVLPALPPLPALGVPADLMLNRPDVEAARQRVVAADHTVAAAIAARLPGLRLSADSGYSSQASGDLFDELTWNIGAGLLAPIFDAGRLAAAVDANAAQLEQALGQFSQTLLQATTDVENALVQERYQLQHLAALERRLGASQALLNAARDRYSNGLSDYLPVLTALVTLQADQQSVLTARRQLLSFRVALHRALGGRWAGIAPDTATAALDAPSRDQPRTAPTTENLP